MEVLEGSDIRKWDELMPDALTLIFNKLSVEDKLTLIPSVCKTWAKIVEGPYCWQHIDILDWSYTCDPDELDRMLLLLIARSSGFLCSLRVSSVCDDHLFEFIAQHAQSLQTLKLSDSKMNDSIIEKVAENFSSLTVLDLSSCEMGARGLQAFGKNCRMLSTLSIEMYPEHGMGNTGEPTHGNEARAIAETMPKLKHLDLAYLHVNTESILEILSGCPELESLHLRGSWAVQLDPKFLEEKYPRLKVVTCHMKKRFTLSDIWTDSDFSDYNNFLEDSDDDVRWWDDGASEPGDYIVPEDMD